MEGTACDVRRIYSFDLFDTLVARPLAAPVDVFFLVGSDARLRYRLPFVTRVGFTRLRIGAERLARVFAKSEDVRLADIYRLLAIVVRNPAELMRREIEIELALIRPIPANVQRIRDLAADGETCCIASDMYLPLPIVRRIVRRHVGTFECFVSSHLGVTKASGRMFEHITNRYRVGMSQLVHAGDNTHSDQTVPGRLGATVLAVEPRGRAGRYPTILEKLASDALPGDPLAKLGYELVGPCCVAFARFIGDRLRAAPSDLVAFGARDTYLVKEIFDRLHPDANTKYFRISRRAVYLAEYGVDKDPARLFEGRITAADFYRRIGVQMPPGHAHLVPRLNREAFLQAAREGGLDEIAATERETLARYFRALGFEGKTAFVDLGWRGTLQDAIKRIMGPDCAMHGYYFGITGNVADKTGFYFHGKRPISRYQRIFQAIAAFEFLFTEPVASLKRVVPAGDGFGFEFVGDEEESQISSRERIARGCRQYFDDYLAVCKVVPDAPASHRAAIDRLLDSHLRQPTAATVDALGAMWHSHSFGGSHRETLCPDGVFHLRKYIDSTWRAAYVMAAAPDAKAVRWLHRTASSVPGALAIDMVRRVVNLFRRIAERGSA